MMNFEVFVKVVDSLCENSDLYFRRTGIGFVCTVVYNDFCFFVFSIPFPRFSLSMFLMVDFLSSVFAADGDKQFLMIRLSLLLGSVKVLC